MQLKSWLKENKIKQGDFAASIGATDSQISRICCGKMVGSPKIIHLISKATDGQVSACDIHGHYVDVSRPEWAQRDKHTAQASTENDKPTSSPTTQANTLA